jgi:hypothetical protein
MTKNREDEKNLILQGDFSEEARKKNLSGDLAPQILQPLRRERREHSGNSSFSCPMLKREDGHNHKEILL